MLMAGPLADQVFEPLMRSGSPTADVLSHLVGSGPGAGIGLMFVLAGLLQAAVGLGGYAFPAVRNAETLIPDHDEALTATEEAASGAT
jgi:hypothetical protein